MPATVLNALYLAKFSQLLDNMNSRESPTRLSQAEKNTDVTSETQN